MKVMVIGGTGLVGSYLLPKLIADGHIVYALTRDNKKIDRISQLGAKGIIGDICKPNEIAANLPDKPDIIVLLAMPSVKIGKRMTKKRKEEMRLETNAFFRNSIDLAINFNIPVILPGGTSYKTIGDEVADESWPIRRIGLTEIGKDTDSMVEEAFRTGIPKAIQLMYGKIYGNGSLFRVMYRMMEKGTGKIIGDGKNRIPNIFAGDAATAIVKTIEKLPVGEKFLIIDDTPITQEQFSCRMAELMGKRKPGKIPGFIIKLVIGRDLYEVIKMDCKASNAKAKRILGWTPEYPSALDGLKPVIEEMKTKEPFFA
jgi:nucleoside-diphosphate-sugar epimerase